MVYAFAPWSGAVVLANSWLCVSLQALASKTLDQASAQFAASALVTSDQLMAFKSKDELVLASGVNGVLTNAGKSEMSVEAVYGV